MENSTTRKIRVTVKDKDSVLFLLNEMEIGKGEVRLELEMKDTKFNYSLLANSPEILDWDFTAERFKEEKEAKGILRGIEPRNWNGLAWRIEDVWKAAIKSPAVLYQSDFFWKVLEQVSSFSITPEHAILTKLGEARYGDWEWEEVDQDLTQILNNEWKAGLDKRSLTELSRIIYGKTNIN